MTKFNNGVQIPQLGLGTYRIDGQLCTRQVEMALALGYRHIDTAFLYQNHTEIAKALANTNVKRNELFITTKIWHNRLSYDDVITDGNLALKELQTEYLDLLLIHWPNKKYPVKETLAALKKLHDEKKIRAIGVSNFDIPHLKDALAAAKELKVSIVCNQVEFHPFLYQKDLLKFCQKHDIAVTAYRPFADGLVFTDGTIVGIAQNHGRTGGQVALRWLLDKGIVAIPKGSSHRHLAENLDVDFILSKEETRLLDNLPQQRLVTPWFAEF